MNENIKNGGNEQKIDRRLAIVFISIFMAILILPTVAWGVIKLIGVFSPEVWAAVNFDTEENRQLATIPEEIDPETLTVDIENWYNDHLPFRSALYAANLKLDTAIEKPYTETIFPALIKIFHPSTPPEDILGGDDYIGEKEDETLPLDDEEQIIPDKVTASEGDPNCDHVIDSGTVELESTCAEYGVILYRCENCSYAHREYIKKAPHDYALTNQVLPTCKSSGENTYVCNFCQKEYIQAVAPAHTGKVIRVVEPSSADYGYTLNKCATCGGTFRADIKNRLSDNSYYPIRYSRNTILGRNNWFFYAIENSLEYYKGTNLLSDSEMEEYTEILRQLKAVCDEKGIKLQILLLPNKNQVYSEHLPTIEVSTKYKRTERLFDYIAANSDVPIIFPQSELRAAKPYWQVYYQYDTHWNKAGAFIGTQALYKALGLETTDLSLQKISLTPRVDDEGAARGDLFSQGGIDPKQYTPENEYYIYYHTDCKATFVAGGDNNADFYQTVCENAANDMHLVFIGDSFRVNMIEFLEKDFTTFTAANRSYNLHRQDRDGDGVEDNLVVIEAIRNADILVVEAVERADSQLFHSAQILLEILLSEE